MDSIKLKNDISSFLTTGNLYVVQQSWSRVYSHPFTANNNINHIIELSLFKNNDPFLLLEILPDVQCINNSFGNEFFQNIKIIQNNILGYVTIKEDSLVIPDFKEKNYNHYNTLITSWNP